MKLNKTKINKLKRNTKRGTMIHEVSEDGTVFYFENEEHKTKLEKRQERKNTRIEERRAARVEERKAARIAERRA